VRLSAEELIDLSYPGPDRSVRLDQLRAGKALPRRYRNRRIGEFLKELDITEGRSTGSKYSVNTFASRWAWQ
jgi:ATP-dependent DNA helicase RecG